MQQLEINKLIRKYFSGRLSDEESVYLDQWLNETSENLQVFEALEKVWKEKSSEPELVNTEALIDKIWMQGVGSEHKKTSNFLEWNFLVKIAAIFLIFVSTPFIIYKFLNQEPVVAEKLLVVLKENPAGQKSKIVLPDGSIAWLNASSSLSYSRSFNESDRTIDLKGEAFFEVARNTSKPFIVNSENLATTALGTSFNIQAYPEQNDVRISLISGEIKVANLETPIKVVYLHPGHEILVHKDTQEIHQQQFKTEEAIGWKDGVLVFKNAGYDEVIQKLARWYGIEIFTEGNPPPDWKLSTSYKNEVLVNILRNLSFGKEFNFDLRNDTLVIRFK
jgi:transmembrane sensor